MGEVGEAVACFSKGLKFAPGDETLLFNRALAYSINGALEEALADLEMARRNGSTKSDLLNARSLTLYKLKRYAEAQTAFQEAEGA
jgi:tetratricopeptide (TPR) repeat protein